MSTELQEKFQEDTGHTIVMGVYALLSLFRGEITREQFIEYMQSCANAVEDYSEGLSLEDRSLPDWNNSVSIDFSKIPKWR